MATTRLQLNVAPGKPYGNGDNIFAPKTENENPEPEQPAGGQGNSIRRKTGIGR